MAAPKPTPAIAKKQAAKAHAKDLRKERRGEALVKRGRRDAPTPRKPATSKQTVSPNKAAPKAKHAAKPAAKPYRPSRTAPKAPKR